MLDIMFDLPENAGARYTITDDIVEGRARPFPIFEQKNKSA